MSIAGWYDRKLLPCAAAAAALAACGVAALAWATMGLRSAERGLATARHLRAQAHEQRARHASEARETAASEAFYRALLERNVVGAERRLEWVESLARVRERPGLTDLRYRISPRRVLRSIPGAPGPIAIHASTLALEVGLLHEGELLALLQDLRRAGYAYAVVRHCSMGRDTAEVAGAGPRLRASCEVELITVEDGGARA